VREIFALDAPAVASVLLLVSEHRWYGSHQDLEGARSLEARMVTCRGEVGAHADCLPRHEWSANQQIHRIERRQECVFEEAALKIARLSDVEDVPALVDGAAKKVKARLISEPLIRDSSKETAEGIG
jgi:hypothetical protein